MLATLLAAFRRLFHHSPSDSFMPNNTALADAAATLKTATDALTVERQHTAAQAQQLIALQQQVDALTASEAAATAHATALQAELDALPDQATVDAAVQEMTTDAGIIGTAPAPTASGTVTDTPPAAP